MKKVIICLFAGVVGCMSVIFGGCLISKRSSNPWSVKKEQDGFYYYIEDEQGGVYTFPNKAYGATILGITSEIDYPNNDELVIPEKLGGYTVKKIGSSYCPVVGYAAEYYGINAAGLKRLIVNHPITVYGFGLEAFYGDLIINSPVEYFIFESISKCKSIQINVDINFLDILWKHESFIYDKLNDYGFYEIKYEAVGGNQKTFITALNKNAALYKSILPEPEEPTKEGYTFGGWFTDKNYGTEWNFEENKVIENMTLYAKWLKN